MVWFEIKLTILWQNTAQIGNFEITYYSKRNALSILQSIE